MSKYVPYLIPIQLYMIDNAKYTGCPRMALTIHRNNYVRKTDMLILTHITSKKLHTSLPSYPKKSCHLFLSNGQNYKPSECVTSIRISLL